EGSAVRELGHGLAFHRRDPERLNVHRDQGREERGQEPNAKAADEEARPRLPAERSAIEVHRPLGRGVDARDGGEDRWLTGPPWADDGEDLSGLDVEIDLVDGCQAAEPHSQLSDVEEGHALVTCCDCLPLPASGRGPGSGVWPRRAPSSVLLPLSASAD